MEAILLEEEKTEVGEDSKILYINDSYNFDTIPFHVDKIIDTDKIEDIF